MIAKFAFAVPETLDHDVSEYIAATANAPETIGTATKALRERYSLRDACLGLIRNIAQLGLLHYRERLPIVTQIDALAGIDDDFPPTDSVARMCALYDIVGLFQACDVHSDAELFEELSSLARCIYYAERIPVIAAQPSR